MSTTLVINLGGSSKKYALYRDGKLALDVRFENTIAGYEACLQVLSAQQVCTAINEADYVDSFSRVYEEVDKYLFKESAGQLECIVIRVMVPGTYFQHHGEITDDYLLKLRQREVTAPVHVPAILREIQSAKKHFRQTKIIAASDSAFHKEIPARAREYSLTPDDAYTHDIHRFGYHGLSVASVVRRIHSLIGLDPEKMIVCHIGNSTSVTAVKRGKSVETSMGFSPGSGFVSGSQTGDLDNGALLELMRVKHLRPRDAEVYLSNSGGLKGMANDSDIRRLLDKRSQNDALATLALDKFVYGIQKQIAAQTVALGGIEVLVLTATAAVRSAELRTLIMSRLEHLGIRMSTERNILLAGKDGVISVRNSPVKVVVMRTDELGEMALIPNQFKQEQDNV